MCDQTLPTLSVSARPPLLTLAEPRSEKRPGRSTYTRTIASQNVIQGVYPAKPPVREDLIQGQRLSVMGNEASAVVEGYLDGDNAAEGKFKIGDRGKKSTIRENPSPVKCVLTNCCPDAVVMGGAQLGQW